MQTLHFHTLAAAVLASAALAFPTAAQDLEGTETDGDVVIHWRAVPLDMAAVAATTPALAISSVTVGPQVSGFPCYGGSAGCADPTANTIAVPLPLSLLSQKAAADVVIQFQDISYTGACTASFTMKQGTTTISGKSLSISGGCQSGFLYLASFSITVPSKPGAARLTGAVVGGTNKSSASIGLTIQ